MQRQINTHKKIGPCTLKKIIEKDCNINPLFVRIKKRILDLNNKTPQAIGRSVSTGIATPSMRKGVAILVA